MQFPLGLYDISLWLGVLSVILLATSELISPYYGRTGLIMVKERLRNTALILGFLFLFTVQ